jgi:hypothetical protein
MSFFLTGGGDPHMLFYAWYLHGKKRDPVAEAKSAQIFTDIYSLYPKDIETFVLPDGARPSISQELL